MFYILISRSEVIAADASSCSTLFIPWMNKVEQIKCQGGILGMFDKNYQAHNHAMITLKLDSKITALIDGRLHYFYLTKNGGALRSDILSSKQDIFVGYFLELKVGYCMLFIILRSLRPNPLRCFLVP